MFSLGLLHADIKLTFMTSLSICLGLVAALLLRLLLTASLNVLPDKFS